MVRHRAGTAFDQQSQRYVSFKQRNNYTVPDSIANGHPPDDLAGRFERARSVAAAVRSGDDSGARAGRRDRLASWPTSMSGIGANRRPLYDAEAVANGHFEHGSLRVVIHGCHTMCGYDLWIIPYPTQPPDGNVDLSQQRRSAHDENEDVEGPPGRVSD